MEVLVSISSTRQGALEALGRLASRQHALARAAAEGRSWRDLAAIAGLSGPDRFPRLAALLERPAMRELVAHYRRAA